MLLTDARRAARSTATASLVPLAEQDRDRWDRAQIEEGVALAHARRSAPDAVGPYQVQAAIAAVHDEAADRGGHRLAADPGALRGARAGVARARW